MLQLNSSCFCVSLIRYKLESVLEVYINFYISFEFHFLVWRALFLNFTIGKIFSTYMTIMFKRIRENFVYCDKNSVFLLCLILL